MNALKLLSKNTLESLRRSKIWSLSQLATMTSEQLLGLPGVDKNALSEIEAALASISIKLNVGPSNGSPNGAPKRLQQQEFLDRGLLETPVTEVFEHNTRIRNAMLVAKIKTLGQLVRTNESQLMGLVNFGRTSLTLVKDALISYKLHLGMTDAQIRAVLGEPEEEEAVQEEPAPVPPPKRAKPVADDGPLAVSIEAALDYARARNALVAAKIKTVGQLVRRQEKELLMLAGFGRTSLAAVNRALSPWALRLGMTEADLESYLEAATLRGEVKPQESSPPEPFDTGDVATHLDRLLSELTGRDRQLIAFYYQNDQKRTLEQTGKRFRLTRERVRQLIARSCKRISRGILRSGFAKVAGDVRARGGFCLPSEGSIPFLCAPVERLRRDARLINTIADSMSEAEAVYFDAEYGLWHLGSASLEERLANLRDQLCVISSVEDVRGAISKTLGIQNTSLPELDSITTAFLANEMMTLPGTQFYTHRKASKLALAEHILRLMFPDGAHFSEIAAATAKFGAAKQLEPRNAHAALTLNSNAILWGRGVFRHKDTIKLDVKLFDALIEKIDEMFLPQVTTVSANAVFDRYKSLVVQVGIPNPGALYASLEWLHPKRFLYRHYPDIESLKATRRPKVRRVEEFEAILEDAEGPLSVEEIIERMGSHRRLKDHHIIQRLPESRCVLLYDAGCYVHEAVLGLPAGSKRDIQNRARAFLRRGPGYATTKQVRLALDLPALKLPWTLRLLGSVLEQDEQLTRIYNVVALGRYESWDSLLARIIRDGIGARPGITLDELNDYLMGHDFITMPLAAKSVPKNDGISISDGYVRARA